MDENELADFLERLARRLRQGEVDGGTIKFTPDPAIKHVNAFEVCITIKPRDITVDRKKISEL
jgi:hypothetical protein